MIDASLIDFERAREAYLFIRNRLDAGEIDPYDVACEIVRFRETIVSLIVPVDPSPEMP